MNRNKNTKLIAILLLAAMLFTLLPAGAFATETGTETIASGNCGKTGENGKDVIWSLSADGTLTISGTGAMADYTPENKVPWYHFFGIPTTDDNTTTVNRITTVVIESGVTSIGNYAFSNCIGLTSISIPNTVTSIGTHAIYCCYNLGNVSIPANVTTIDDHAFSGCSSLATITFGENSQLTSIGEYAFSSCDSLTRIDIPASVTSIGKQPFSGCSSLATITFGDNSKLKSIGQETFSGCTSLSSITFGKNSQLESIGQEAFSGCTSLSSITFGENSQLKSIGQKAFYGCTTMSSITFVGDSQLTTIGDQAFQDCTGLTSIDIPDSVTSIGAQAFSGCTSLTSIAIPDSVDSIGEYAFLYCTGLTSITIPASVTSIGENAFYGTALTTVTVPCNWDGSDKFVNGVTVNRAEHKDENKDYLCDICGEAVGTRPSGGGFSGSYNYPVKADNVDGADVTLSDSYAVKGETVTITVKPEAGKQVSEVIVTDADGKVIPVTKAGDNQYTFTMPAGKVNIAVTTEAAAYDLRIVMQINNKNIVANNQTIKNDVAPVIVGDRTLVPVRVVTELLGGTAHWDNDTRTVTLKMDGKVLTMTIGKEIPGFGTSAVILNSRTYVPIRYVMEMLGAEVTWINATQQIIIEK